MSKPIKEMELVWEPHLFRCVVQLDDVQETTSGGLYLSDQTLEKEKFATQYGRILKLGGLFDLGHGDLDEQFIPEEGDYVLFKKYAGMDHPTDKTIKFLNDDDIVGFARNGVA